MVSDSSLAQIAIIINDATAPTIQIIPLKKGDNGRKAISRRAQIRSDNQIARREPVFTAADNTG